MSICRLCLHDGDEEQIVSIWDCEVEDLTTKIWECVSINITRDDTLPTMACQNCIRQIIQWEDFRNTCQKSNEWLLHATTIELKITDDDFLVNDDGTLNENIKQVLNDKEKQEKKHVNKRVSKKCPSPDLSEKENSDEEEDADYLETDYIDFEAKEELTQIYECEICTLQFDNCFEFLDHQELHDGEPVFQCDKCSDVFTTRNDLVEHDRNHRTPCPHCGKMILKTSIKLHLIKHTDKYKCEECNGRFNSRAALSQHTITVHTDIKNHICEVCGKRFSSKTAMQVHMKSHSDERLYPCKLCNYAGRTASAIYVHMSTHATDLCVCEVCSKTYKSTRNLNDHLRRVHSKIKKHQCNYCDKKFVDKYMLKVHTRCHTGVRPYKCSFCGKAFIRSDGLKEHMIIHGQRVIYDCKDCGKKFTSKRSIVRHNCIFSM